MASTITLQRSITLSSAFIRYAPLQMSANDPALSNADWVRQFILSAPFAWRWNRIVLSFQTEIGQSDYVVDTSNFGWIEKAVFYNPDDGNKTFELEVENNLGVETQPNQPTKISAQLDNDEGQITFRLVPCPDSIYNVEVTAQKAAPTFTNPSETWSPIPDYYSYLYNQGFLAKNYEYINDPRYLPAMQLFLQQVVSANEGLSDAAKNIFLTDRLDTQRQTQNVSGGRG
jgi:hypothetical protein